MQMDFNPWLVAASLLVAMLASYTALDMAGRVTAAHGRAARLWLLGGSVAMGIGIWSMHFIGMLALRLPMRMDVSYDLSATLLSLVLAVCSSAFALVVVCQPELTYRRICAGAVVMGAGIAAMHYCGMAAMQMRITYDPALFSLSILIAVAASAAALWTAFRLRQRSPRAHLQRFMASIAMGIAIAGMHYTGMAAARFPAMERSMPTEMAAAVHGRLHPGMSGNYLALLTIVSALAILSIALLVSVLDTRLESQTEVLASSLAFANQELQFMALHDALTKLPNRNLLGDRLRNEIAKARRSGGTFALLFLDLDGFKQVNDAFGHHTGDQLLVEIAERLRTFVQPEHTIARLGGDEFILLAPAANPEQARTISQELIQLLRSPIRVSAHEVCVTASIGIAMFGGGENEEDVMKHADSAMYQAKALGRNNFQFYEPSLQENAQQQLELIHDLHQAEQRGEFVLHYQPKIDARTGEVEGAESLLRWQHPTLGLIPPAHFVPLAEKTGLIIPIGLWVLEESCRQLSLWHAEGHANWTMSVNLSAVQFNHPGLLDALSAILKRHGIAPGSLTLEITESTAMREPDSALAILRQLAGLGVKISIDDFGTGYSSLLYLKRLPASELKVDRGFVRQLPGAPEDAAIISAIVALGRTLNLNIVAEGVETESQRSFLKDLGCSTFQGFLFAQGVSASDFVQASAAIDRDALLALEEGQADAEPHMPGMPQLAFGDLQVELETT